MMQRELPTYNIRGTDFIVDVDFNLLRHPEDDRLAYNFFEDMVDTGKNYQLYIGDQDLTPSLTEERAGSTIDIPYMVQLDAEGIREKYGIAPGYLPDSDRLLEPNAGLMRRREMGKPAAVTLGEDYLFVDVASGYVMVPGTPSSHWLNTAGMAYDHFRTCYRCLYDPEERKEFKPKGTLEIPPGIIAIEIPQFRFSDSYNYRKVMGDKITLSEKEYFRRFPIRSNMPVRLIAPEALGYTQKVSNMEGTQIKPAPKKQGEAISPKRSPERNSKGKGQGKGK